MLNSSRIPKVSQNLKMLVSVFVSDGCNRLGKDLNHLPFLRKHFSLSLSLGSTQNYYRTRTHTHLTYADHSLSTHKPPPFCCCCCLQLSEKMKIPFSKLFLLLCACAHEEGMPFFLFSIQSSSLTFLCSRLERVFD